MVLPTLTSLRAELLVVISRTLQPWHMQPAVHNLGSYLLIIQVHFQCSWAKSHAFQHIHVESHLRNALLLDATP